MTYVGPKMRGHPREPSTFEFSETITGADGEVRRRVRSYVAFDSRWPWWRRVLVALAGKIVEGAK